MPITNNSYNSRSGAMIYAISAAEGAEAFQLAVRPMGRDRSQLTLWQGDRYGKRCAAKSEGRRD
jgi:hypothetical protein